MGLIIKIIEAKEKYLTFRKDTEFCDFMNGLFFTHLDEALIEFFGAFTDVSDMKRAQPQVPQPEPEPGEVEIITNNFNRNDIDFVINHFAVLEKYMKNGEYMQWIKLAFELQELPERKFILTGNTISEIRSIFFNYWERNWKKGEKNKYVKLLSDYFHGFDFKNTRANFNK